MIELISNVLNLSNLTGASATSSKKSGSTGGGLFDVFKDILGTIGGAGGVGRIVNKVLDGIGLPDVVGDIVGTATDCLMGNYPAAISGGVEALKKLTNSKVDFTAFLPTGNDTDSIHQSLRSQTHVAK